jgi:VIT1/CCC1 family predicted Fe2+/Mn2+ transporter
MSDGLTVPFALVAGLSGVVESTGIFMMKFELGLDKPDPVRARTSAVTIAVSYIVGGLVPLAPYFILRSVGTALVVSALVTVSVGIAGPAARPQASRRRGASGRTVRPEAAQGGTGG